MPRKTDLSYVFVNFSDFSNGGSFMENIATIFASSEFREIIRFFDKTGETFSDSYHLRNPSLARWSLKNGNALESQESLKRLTMTKAGIVRCGNIEQKPCTVIEYDKIGNTSETQPWNNNGYSLSFRSRLFWTHAFGETYSEASSATSSG